MSWKERTGKDPIWCPGCGDFGVLRAMQKAVDAQGLALHETVLVTGIGCSGTITSGFRSYGFHGLHGRALPVATGIKLASPESKVLVAGGDGDGYGIGLGHFMHAARRNVDLTYIVMDNQVYGLTKGQTSPTTSAGMTTKASPLGPMAEPVRPMELALAGGASFIAQAYSADQKQLQEILEAAIAHPGFALVNVQSPCVTYNMLNTYEWFKQHTVKLDHDPTDRAAAMAWARRDDVVPTGILYQVARPVFGGDLKARNLEAPERLDAWAAAYQVR